MNNDCTLVVSSCDKCEDLWPIFFKILSVEWPDLDMPIVLNTEGKSFSYPGYDIRCFNMYTKNEDVSWTRRLKETLKKIDTKYVLFMLDDFFLLDSVDNNEIQKCIHYMDNNKRISVFSFMQTFSENILDERYPQFEKRPFWADYKFNCQAGIWNRKRLISYLDIDETPWEWETIGNIRSFKHPLHLFYSIKAIEKPIIPYIYHVNDEAYGGLAVFRGKWYLPYVEPLFEKHGIAVDYSLRGCCEINNFEDDSTKKINNGTMERVKKRIRPLYVPFFKIIYIIQNFKHFI